MTNPKSTSSLETKQPNQLGWDARARTYHNFQGKVSAQAVGPGAVNLISPFEPKML